MAVSNNDDLNNYLGNLAGGLTTFYVQGGVTNNPSTQSARGLILKETPNNGGSNYGIGYLVDLAGSTWSISVSGSTTPTYKLIAKDSAVVHNSGNEEIGGQKTFDTAPIDKTTGNPYITKSDLPSDNNTVVKVVTQAQYASLAGKSGLYVIQG